jgi:DNA primase
MINKVLKDKLYEYALKNMGMKVYVRGWLKGTCPSCGRTDKFGINLGMNRTNCFVCGYHPTPITLVTDLEGFSSFNETIQFFKTFEGIRYKEPKVERVEKKQVELPEGYTNVALGDSRIGKIARSYIKRRGFDLHDSALKGWGYCTKGDYLGYLILPFYTAGELTYFNGRLLVGVGPKYQNPRIEDFGTGKSLILYNADALFMYEEIYLLEGVFNAETLGVNGIATGGKNISDYQISLINKAPVKRVIIVLDPDAINDAIRIGLQLAFYKQVKIATWEGEQDVNDLGKEESLKRISKSPWLTYNQLLRMKNEKGA